MWPNNNIDRNLNNNQNEKNTNDSLYVILMRGSFVLVALITIISVLCLVDYGKSISLIDVESIKNNVNNISDKQEKSIKKADEISLTYQSLLKEKGSYTTYDEKIAEISDVYATIDDYQLVEDLMNGITYTDVYDYSAVVDKVKDAEGIVNKNKDDINYLSDNLEDKANYTADMSTALINNHEFISANGLEEEFVDAFDYFYPIGSIYISIDGTLPSHGTWQQIESNRTLWSVHDGDGSLVEPTLPNVVGNAGKYLRNGGTSGAFSQSGIGSQSGGNSKIGWNSRSMDLSRANSIYQNGATVRPPSIAVAIFKRVG